MKRYVEETMLNLDKFEAEKKVEIFLRMNTVAFKMFPKMAQEIIEKSRISLLLDVDWSFSFIKEDIFKKEFTYRVEDEEKTLEYKQLEDILLSLNKDLESFEVNFLKSYLSDSERFRKAQVVWNEIKEDL